jgi:hypothetical protein
MFGLPLGKLVSLGSSNGGTANRIIFSGAGTPLSADADNTAPEFVVSIMDTSQALTSHAFPQRKGGMTNMPLDKPLVKWVYYLAATAGLSESATWADLESRLNRLLVWVASTYNYFSHGNVSGTPDKAGAGGQVGDLVVLDAGGTARWAPVELATFPAGRIPPGQVGFYEIELTFRLFDWFV